LFKSFFGSRQYFFWAWPGVVLIVSGIACQVQIDVALNSGIGELFDVMQQSLSQPGSVELSAFESIVWALTKLVLLYVVLVVALGFYIKHWVFRWRQAMNDYYMKYWPILRSVEGASQRVQEDTKRFAATFELIGASVVEAVLTLFAFLPILWVISKNVHHIPFFGQVDHALVYAAVAYALAGTVLLALVGFKLPGLEFDNQKAEAAYRKELVYAEDDTQRGSTPVVQQLFSILRKSYHRLFFHYLYFDTAKLTYLQFGIVVPFLVLGPTVIAGTLTLGMFAQTIRSFERIQTSFQVLVRNWASMVELLSVFKRLRAFEANIKAAVKS
jgi:peptide/bleomycin uptake transporter